MEQLIRSLQQHVSIRSVHNLTSGRSVPIAEVKISNCLVKTLAGRDHIASEALPFLQSLPCALDFGLRNPRLCVLNALVQRFDVLGESDLEPSCRMQSNQVDDSLPLADCTWYWVVRDMPDQLAPSIVSPRDGYGFPPIPFVNLSVKVPIHCGDRSCKDSSAPTGRCRTARRSECPASCRSPCLARPAESRGSARRELSCRSSRDSVCLSARASSEFACGSVLRGLLMVPFPSPLNPDHWPSSDPCTAVACRPSSAW